MSTKKPEFTVGQKVKLNTGGPEMSVEHAEGDSCVCRWFVNGVAKTSKFVAQCLEPVAKRSPVIYGKNRTTN